MAIHHYTLLATDHHLTSLNSSLKWDAVQTLSTMKVRLLRISWSVGMETVYFTLHVGGMMWILSGISSLMKDVTPMFKIRIWTHHYTLHAIWSHWTSLDSSLKGDAVLTFLTGKVRLLRISHLMRMEMVCFTLRVSGMMWALSNISSLMKDVTPTFKVLPLETLHYTLQLSMGKTT